MMKRLFLFGSLLVLGLASCQSKQEYFTKEELVKKSDSLTALRFRELQKQAAVDLDHRIAIEVKPKVDSILADLYLTLTALSATDTVALEMPPMAIPANNLSDTGQTDSL